MAIPKRCRAHRFCRRERDCVPLGEGALGATWSRVGPRLTRRLSGAAKLDAIDKLARQRDLFASRGASIGLVYCGYSLIDERGRPSDRTVIAPRLRGDVLAELLVAGNLISGSRSAVVVRRSLLERAGGFDESLSFVEDWDLWLRLAELCEVDFVPEPLVAIRVHDENMQHREARHKLKVHP